MKKRFSKFYIIYFIAVAAAVLAINLALIPLNSVLAEYEEAQPKNIAADIFENYFSKRNFDGLFSNDGFSLSKFDTKESASRAISDYIGSGELSYSGVSSGMSDIEKYVVKSDDKKFSSFELKKSGEKTRHGFDVYALAGLDFSTALARNIRITSPIDYKVYINGVLLTRDDIADGAVGLTTLSYFAEKVFAGAEVTAFDENGAPCVVEYSEADDYYSVKVNYSDELREQYGDYVIEAAESFAAYMQNDKTFAQIKKYFDSSSPLYDSIRTSQVVWVIDHSSYDFADVKVGEFLRQDENSFSCRVSFTHILHYNGLEDYKDYIDMTLYLRRVGDTYLIYDRFNNN